MGHYIRYQTNFGYTYLLNDAGTGYGGRLVADIRMIHGGGLVTDIRMIH